MRFFYKDKIEEYKKTFIEPAKDFPEFSRLEMAIFIEAFHEYDLNNNGTIDASELKLVFKAMGQGSSDQEVKSFMDKVDPKQTGELSFVQFLQVYKLNFSQSSNGKWFSSIEKNKGDEIDLFFEKRKCRKNLL